jgi:hypothetical protein
MNMFFMSKAQRNNLNATQSTNNFMGLRTNTLKQIVNAQTVVAQHPQNKPPQMKWGPPTWLYLHTMAEKVKETSFQQIRADMFRTISTICTNLPCSICSNHAREYFSKINVQSIQTKDDMKKFLFVFHNSVNARKQFKQFAYSDLTETYSTGDYKSITNNFMRFYQEKTRNIHLIADEMHRQRIVKLIKQWIIDNIEHFE